MFWDFFIFLTIFDNFWIFGGFLWNCGFLSDFLGFFLDFFFGFFFNFLVYFEFLVLLNFLDFFWIFLFFFLFFSNLIRLLLHVTMVTTGHQKLPKMG